MIQHYELSFNPQTDEDGVTEVVLRADHLREVSALQQSHGVQLIAAERKRQIEVEGWTPAHDDGHDEGEMAIAAACYASPVPLKAEMDIPCGCREASCHHTFGRIGTEWRNPWPWEESWWKPSNDPIRNLVKAGALIAAEIDRLQRAAIAEATPEGDSDHSLKK